MTALLRVEGLETAYGPSQVLFGLDLEIDEGEVVGLLGRNGMGKTTTVRSITGLTPPLRGRIWLAGERIDGRSACGIARAGVGLVPEGRQVFPNLTARENLQIAARPRVGAATPWTLPRILELFPQLAERLAAMGRTLSGGEQQMLAIGRALLTNPRLLVLDEATEGLAPLIRREIWRCLTALKAAGQAVLIIDKNVGALTRVADRAYILEKGRVAWHGASSALRNDPEVQRRFLGIGA